MAQPQVKFSPVESASAPQQARIVKYVDTRIDNMLQVWQALMGMRKDGEKIMLPVAAKTYKYMADNIVAMTPQDLGHGARNWHASQDGNPANPYIGPPAFVEGKTSHLKPKDPNAGIEMSIGKVKLDLSSESGCRAFLVNEARWIAIAERGEWKTGVMKTYPAKRKKAAIMKMKERKERDADKPNVGGYSQMAPRGIMEILLDKAEKVGLAEMSKRAKAVGYGFGMTGQKVAALNAKKG